MATGHNSVVHIIKHILLLLDMVVVVVDVSVVVIEDRDICHMMVILHSFFVLDQVFSLMGEEAGVGVPQVGGQNSGTGWRVVVGVGCHWRVMGRRDCRGWSGHGSSTAG